MEEVLLEIVNAADSAGMPEILITEHIPYCD